MDPEPFDEESVEGKKPKAVIPPLPPNLPPEEAATMVLKIKHNTTPHIDMDEVAAEYITYDDDTEDSPPLKKITRGDRDEEEEYKEQDIINPPSPAEEQTWNHHWMKFQSLR